MNKNNKINKIAAAVSRGVTRGAEDLKLLARFYSGEAFHLYSGWSHRCGRYTLRSGERYTLRSGEGAGRIYSLLSAAGLLNDLTEGNDAPRGGAVGDYYQARRCYHQLAEKLKTLSALVETVARGREKPDYFQKAITAMRDVHAGSDEAELVLEYFDLKRDEKAAIAGLLA